MANDDDFILGGRKTKKSSSPQGTPRTQKPRGGGNQSAIKLGSLSGGSMSFTKRLAKDMAIAKRDLLPVIWTSFKGEGHNLNLLRQWLNCRF